MIMSGGAWPVFGLWARNNETGQKYSSTSATRGRTGLGFVPQGLVRP
jgi:hypothetical protein